MDYYTHITDLRNYHHGRDIFCLYSKKTKRDLIFKSYTGLEISPRHSRFRRRRLVGPTITQGPCTVHDDM